MKDNKLIAEFMGANPFRESKDVQSYEMYGVLTSKGREYGGINEQHFFLPEEMLFHKSWDWLMPVVESCYHNGADENEVGDITHALLDCDIDNTHKAVVEFINQLNK